ncbi:hypothetical protein NK8_54920 (plasmid) [Caballeronia sp. NK8]|uniref:hypothetical protein n=1 Tax=Caballeronia sp. NK8 TaxID=140098 RepID=UPI001BB49377|nr:hypothetical protein [Caballeronia sp. NK8]BCQ27303.1 hypothetical protein NK8_54920 [Caballeronia sp. NK8]
MKIVLVSATLVAVVSLGSLAQAEEATDTLQSIPAPRQQSAQSATPSDDTAYGGAATGQSASGSTSKWAGGAAVRCNPQPFCNIYSGGGQ